MATIPDMKSGWTSRAVGVINHPETGFPLSIDATLFTRQEEGQNRAFLTLDSMPKELLGTDSAFLIRPEVINQRPVVPVEVETLPSGGCVLNMKPEAYSQEREINAGYQILAKAVAGPVEYAFGENPKTHFFVTWERTPGNDKAGETNYYWGHYHEDRGRAIEDFCTRVCEKCAELAEERKPSIRQQLAAEPVPGKQTAKKLRGAEAR